MLTLDTSLGAFIIVFLETNEGNYEWSDPEYPGGDNTIKRFHGTYQDWCKQIGIKFGRDKGEHVLRNYCGEDVRIIHE